jgi:hypothetical protein
MTLSLAARILKHTRRDGVAPPGLFGPCWVWTARCDPDGYGQVSLHGRTKQAHWASYEHERGPVPPGLELDHPAKCEGFRLNAVDPLLDQLLKVYG